MEKEEERHCVSLVPIFKALDQDDLGKISQKITSRELAKGEILYSLNDNDDTLYIIHTGELKNYRILENGKEQLVRLLGPGAFTGEWSIFKSDIKHNDYIEALKPTEICQLTRQGFKQVLGQYPEISMSLLQHMSERLDISENQTATLAYGSITKRITSYLADLIINSKVNREGTVQVVLPMTRKDLASYLGTTPESVTRGFNKLEKEGIIESISNKIIQVNDFSDL
ncbi:Crp/Fnr family transcriptional regulator [Weissella paramesenteroides]|uniref:Crp/Fnr family transcriptional regulator n=1 Tax=Weissella paramesenteroides TaxID=1249 RepID=UPI00207300DE|nr:Crp/Fnr family transcriptional regulator [Weissella paramesenteroides]MCM6764747.1 Crp/Fnr family transcriptional regulator [Weissella paramesenteroides]MCM6768143.1 Crp/Fnr family transcriptional regulator [Weissella paramesenteroides]MCM6768604.1 Crp/Fnr family transcriptional regulator [Weissella paramesenteroides]MCM6770684.1 Crp/Fnr family transcriptional regulator [Weissella paramesenteroides]MCM6780607.1 Crp/Fnr family transcriptional regulator [Weissella paramesenteroides]